MRSVLGTNLVFAHFFSKRTHQSREAHLSEYLMKRFMCLDLRAFHHHSLIPSTLRHTESVLMTPIPVTLVAHHLFFVWWSQHHCIDIFTIDADDYSTAALCIIDSPKHLWQPETCSAHKYQTLLTRPIRQWPLMKLIVLLNPSSTRVSGTPTGFAPHLPREYPFSFSDAPNNREASPVRF